jgi:hypothetical protein
MFMRNLLLMLFVLFLTACGGNPDNAVPAAVPTGTVSGTVFDSLIINGTVSVYDFTTGKKGALLAKTVSDNTGLYSLTIQTESKPILIELTGGFYIEEAGVNAKVSLKPTHKLTALTNYVTGTKLSVAITSFTHLAAGLANYEIKKNVNIKTAIEDANQRISALTGLDIIATTPALITDANNASGALTDELKYGFLAGAISTWTHDHAPSTSLAHFPPYTSIDFAQLMYQDIADDGVLDGFGLNTTGSKVQLSFAGVSLNPAIYRLGVGVSILQIAAHKNNATLLSGATLLNYAQAFMANTDEIFKNIPPIAISNPLVTITSPADNAYMRNIVSITSTIDTLVGVKKIELYVDGVLFDSINDNLKAASFNLDTSKVNDGSHVIAVKATDFGDTTTTKTIKLNVNNTPAVITFLSPSNNIWVSGSIEIRGAVQSGVAISKVDLLVDNLNIATATIPTQPTFSLDTSKFADGTHTVSLNVTDAGGVVTTESIQAKFDNAAPLVEISMPVVQTWNKGTTVVSGSVTSANVGSTIPVVISKLELLVDDSIVDTKSFSTNEPSFNLNTLLYTSGSHKIGMRVTNTNGKSGVGSVQANISNIAPAVSITSPVASTTKWYKGDITITSNITSEVPLASIDLIVDNIAVQTKTTGFNNTDFILKTAELSAGQHSVSVKATNIGGLVTTNSVLINTNNTPPTVSISAPTEFSWVKGLVTVSSSAVSPITISSVDLLIDGVKTTGSNLQFDSTQYSTGAHTLVVSATDISGLVATKSIQINIGNTPPAVQITSQVSGTWQTGSITINSTIATQIPLVKVDFLLDGAVIQNRTSGLNAVSFILNTTGLTQGSHIVGIAATDIAGLTTTSNLQLNFINTPPLVSISSPVTDVWLNGNVQVSSNIVSSAPLAKADLLIDNVIVGSTTSNVGSPNFVLNTSQYSGGSHILSVRATDIAGLATTSSRFININNAAPVVNIVSPVANSFNRNIVTISATAQSIAPINSLEFYINGVLKYTENVNTNASFYLQDTSPYFDGAATLTIKATDRGGLVTINNQEIKIDNTLPVFSGTITHSTFNIYDIAGTISDNYAGIASFKTADGMYTFGVSSGSIFKRNTYTVVNSLVVWDTPGNFGNFQLIDRAGNCSMYTYTGTNNWYGVIPYVFSGRC